MEAEAVLSILEMCEQGNVALVSSDALVQENARNPLPERRIHGEFVLGKADETIRLDETVVTLARALQQQYHVGAFDALHLALAKKGEVDYFVTCDDRLLQKAKKMDLPFEPISPIALFEKLTREQTGEQP